VDVGNPGSEEPDREDVAADEACTERAFAANAHVELGVGEPVDLHVVAARSGLDVRAVEGEAVDVVDPGSDELDRNGAAIDEASAEDVFAAGAHVELGVAEPVGLHVVVAGSSEGGFA